MGRSHGSTSESATGDLEKGGSSAPGARYRVDRKRSDPDHKGKNRRARLDSCKAALNELAIEIIEKRLNQ